MMGDDQHIVKCPECNSRNLYKKNKWHCRNCKWCGKGRELKIDT